MVLRRVLPEHHINSESKDVVKLGTGLIGTLAALVLGLLIASAKSSFDAQRTGFQQLAANLVTLDRVLAQYGPETKQTRESLRELVASTIDRLWPQEGAGSERANSNPGSAALGGSAISARGAALLDRIRDLRERTKDSAPFNHRPFPSPAT